MELRPYAVPDDLDDALELLQRAAGEARILAGGTDLMLDLRQGKRSAKTMVDISRLPGLDAIERQHDYISLGARVTHAQAAASPLVREKLPALARACASVGSPQIRNVGTLVGNIVSAQPGADGALALQAYETRVRVVGREGARTMPLAELYLGLGQCCVDSCNEIITHVMVAVPATAQLSAFQRLSQRGTLTLPVVNAAVGLVMDQDGRRVRSARVVVGPVASTPFRSRRAEEILQAAATVPEAFGPAARAAAEESRPRASLLRGGAEYRREMVAVMVRRALEGAWRGRPL
jgi:carbon-monoxide dehydrogenase medium subunit